MLATFLKEEDGAITVDYVVLTAGVTGMGLGMLAIVGPSLQELASKISIALETTTAGPIAADVIASNDFTGATTEWTGATASTVTGFGDVLGPIAGSQGLESVSTSIDIPAGSESATITFDLYALDSLDDEDAVLFIDGVEVGRMSANGGELTWSPGTTSGISLSADIIASGEPLGGNQTGTDWWWNDGIGSISITVDNPNDTLSFGIGSTADQPVSDESWALDNFVVTAG